MSISTVVGQAFLGVCLQLAAATESTPIFVPMQEFTLAWDHSIEKVRWEEDYELRISEEPEPSLSDSPVLVATAARIKGSAAGMEPPEHAVLKEGWYHYTPHIREHQVLRLTRSEFVPDYEWCDQKGCRSLSEILPLDGGVTLMWACSSP